MTRNALRQNVGDQIVGEAPKMATIRKRKRRKNPKKIHKTNHKSVMMVKDSEVVVKGTVEGEEEDVAADKMAVKRMAEARNRKTKVVTILGRERNQVTVLNQIGTPDPLVPNEVVRNLRMAKGNATQGLPEDKEVVMLTGMIEVKGGPTAVAEAVVEAAEEVVAEAAAMVPPRIHGEPRIHKFL